MDFKELSKTLDLLHKANITPLLVGSQGIGKTEFVKKYAEDNNFHFISLRLGQSSDGGDITGLPLLQEGRTTFLPPDIFPKDKNKPVLLFLDEINRTSKDIFQYIFETIESTTPRKIGAYTLPEGSFVVAAQNPATEEFIVTDFGDRAFQSRTCFIKVEPTLEEFIKYTGEKKEISKFVLENPTFLEDNIQFNGPEVKDRRSWTKIQKIIDLLKVSKSSINENYVKEIFEGIIGKVTATTFFSYLQNNIEVLVTLEELFEGKVDLSKLTLSNKQTLLNDLVEFLVFKQEEQNSPEVSERIVDFLLTLQKEQVIAFLQENWDRCSWMYLEIGENDRLHKFLS